MEPVDVEPVAGDDPGRTDEHLPGWVLVVDDTESIRRLIRINLELADFRVVERADGEAALEVLQASYLKRHGLPVAVVVDAQMEPRDGWWTVDQIRRQKRIAHLPVVMVTAAIQDYDKRRAATAGLDAFVGKPFDPDHLVSLVEGFAAHGRGFETADRP